MPPQKTHLIVTGVARSGTTALAELLNTHPAICMGIERFKFRYLREQRFDDGFLTKERFFDFRRGDTNLLPDLRPAWAPIYKEMEGKWDEAQIVGDKTPDLIPVLPDFMAQNPNHRFICMLRNLRDVALSWQARADRRRDAWPKGRGFEAACDSWQTQMEALHDLMRHKPNRDRILLLDYDRMHTAPERTARGLLAHLGLSPSDPFLERARSHAGYVAKQPRKRVPPQFAERYQTIPMGHARGLRKIAREQMDQLTPQKAAA